MQICTFTIINNSKTFLMLLEHYESPFFKNSTELYHIPIVLVITIFY